MVAIFLKLCTVNYNKINFVHTKEQKCIIEKHSFLCFKGLDNSVEKI